MRGSTVGGPWWPSVHSGSLKGLPNVNFGTWLYQTLFVIRSEEQKKRGQMQILVQWIKGAGAFIAGLGAEFDRMLAFLASRWGPTKDDDDDQMPL